MADENLTLSQASEPRPFLTPECIKLVEHAVQQARQHVSEYISQHGDYYWAMPKRQQSNHRRNIYVAALNKSFSGHEGIAIRDDYGGFYVVLGVSGLLHLKKVDRKTLLAWIPQTLQQNMHPQQLPLGELINEQNIPLNQLHCLVIGFVENKLGDLEAVYIIEQTGDTIDYRLPLEIIATIPFTAPASDEADIPFPKFNAKKKDEDKTTGAS